MEPLAKIVSNFKELIAALMKQYFEVNQAKKLWDQLFSSKKLNIKQLKAQPSYL